MTPSDLYVYIYTLPKTNMDPDHYPDHDPLEDAFPLPTDSNRCGFQGPCQSTRVYISCCIHSIFIQIQLTKLKVREPCACGMSRHSSAKPANGEWYSATIVVYVNIFHSHHPALLAVPPVTTPSINHHSHRSLPGIRL